MFAFDLAEKGPAHDNWRLIENTILEDLDRPYTQFNLGFGLIQVAYVVESDGPASFDLWT